MFRFHLIIVALLLLNSMRVSGQEYPHNYQDIIAPLSRAADSLIRLNKGIGPEAAAQQLLENRVAVDVNVRTTSDKELSVSELYTDVSKSTVLVSGAGKCDRCDQIHTAPSSGYIIDESGVVVTNYHVVHMYSHSEGNVQQLALVVRLHDGRTYGVSEVLVASAKNDLAVLKLDVGDDRLPSLSLADSDPLIGEDVFVVSHPQGMFYAFSSGMVTDKFSGEFPVLDGGEPQTRKALSISADFATGSSGAAVVNAQGQVVATVSSTNSLLHHGMPGKPVQMVVKSTIPVSSLWQLISKNKE